MMRMAEHLETAVTGSIWTCVMMATLIVPFAVAGSDVVDLTVTSKACTVRAHTVVFRAALGCCSGVTPYMLTLPCLCAPVRAPAAAASITDWCVTPLAATLSAGPGAQVARDAL